MTTPSAPDPGDPAQPAPALVQPAEAQLQPQPTPRPAPTPPQAAPAPRPPQAGESTGHEPGDALAKVEPAPRDPAGLEPARLGPASVAELGGDEQPSMVPDSLFERMRADPTHAAELLALGAVDRFGSEAHEWVATYRHYYPHATEAQMAEIVRRRFVRLSQYSGAVAGVAGGFGAVVDFGVLAWNQARMVLHIAAIHGHDPTSRERAAELLTLQNVHKLVDRARTALDVAARKAPPSELMKHGGGSIGALAFSLAKMAGMRVARRAVMKVVPFASIPLGAWANGSSTASLAQKAIALYGRDQ